METELILGILTAAVGLFTTYLAWKQKQVEAQAVQREAVAKNEQARSDAMARSNGQLIDQLQEEVRRLALDLDKARGEISGVYAELSLFRSRLIEVEIGAKILTSQVEAQGETPLWKMPPPIVTPTPATVQDQGETL